MSTYYGDFAASSTVYMVFDSFAAATGASSATSNFAAADIICFKDGSATERTSANGITVTTSFNSSTGLQMIAIDTSDNTDAGFWAAGHEYQIAVADITIDTQTVRFWLGTFSIERASGVLAKLISGVAKVDVNTIKTQTVTCSGGVTVPAATLASTTNITAAAGCAISSIGAGVIANASFASDVGSTAIATNVIGIAAKKGVVDALNVDTYAEPGQETPAATNTLVKKLGYLFKAWRNKTDQTSSTYKLYNDDAATVDQKATFADNGTTATKGEVATGP